MVLIYPDVGWFFFLLKVDQYFDADSGISDSDYFSGGIDTMAGIRKSERDRYFLPHWQILVG